MSLSDLASLGSFVSGVAVLASLVFLYFQMRQMTDQVRQAEKSQLAGMRHGRATRNIEIALAILDADISDAISKGMAAAADTTDTQRGQFGRYCGAVFAINEDVYYQHKEGALDHAAFESAQRRIRENLRWPGMRAAWKRARRLYADDFVQFMDKIAAEAPVRQSRDAAVGVDADDTTETALA